jgi:hypothetical protein
MILPVLCLILLTPPASGNTIYTYKGNPFEIFSGTYQCPPTCAVSGFFEIAANPPTNLIETDAQFLFNVTPIDYSFTSGDVTATPANSCPDFFNIGTDSSGNITFWVIRVATRAPDAACTFGRDANVQGILTVKDRPGGASNGSAIDFTSDTLFSTNFASTNQNPGTWTT